MRLYHGTPFLREVLTAGVVRPSTRPEAMPDLTATLAAYRRLLAGWMRRWPDPPEPYTYLDPEGHGDWVAAAIMPMRGFAYATTNAKTAARYAADRVRGADPGVVVVEANRAALLPDEDWIGCVAAYTFTDCTDCDLEVRGDEDEYEAWRDKLPRLISSDIPEEIAAEINFIQHEIDWDGFCTLPLNAVLGRTVIRDLMRSPRGLAWLHAGVAFADRFAHQGPLRVVERVGAVTLDGRIRRH